ncbi:MAG: 5-(carboxyamino)imidazole ribonucleotide synthase [Alphaproteobacteria bacterium]|nr:5-(carboxyamino)imidazole ribonucleotide synthase [Alphaproteobacteria bacterium]
MARVEVIAPGATIGILGGGQLGRMLALAAARLGYRCHIFAPEADQPAAQVCAAATRAAYDDAAALRAFAAAVSVVTYEFENVPVETIRLLDPLVPVRPGARSLEVAQDRQNEKTFAHTLGIGTAPFAQVDDLASLKKAVATIGLPAILKTRRLGYDGKGQAAIATPNDCDTAWASIGKAPAILEARVDFEREISVVVARGLDGKTACYVPVENVHRAGILDTSTAPASIPPALARDAEALAARVVEALGHVGVLCVELFVTKAGVLLMNELAPRVHNSGHWTIDACGISQFEQHMRAVCGLPLGDPARHSDAVMKNLIGDDAARWPALLADPGALVHLYGKAEARPGRKMGHVTWLKPRQP